MREDVILMSSYRGKRIALLSNVNMNFVIRLLQKQIEVYEVEGYGNELGTLMNHQSSYYAFAPEITFLVLDLMEILQHDLEIESAKAKVYSWFDNLEGSLQTGNEYYISDAYLWGSEIAVIHDMGRKIGLEQIWQEKLQEFCNIHNNVYILPYRYMIEKIGEERAFSKTMWYLGKVPLSNEAQNRLCNIILDCVRVGADIPKKVLLLDLDNTLWGGLAGEQDKVPITLSDDHDGLVYKNLQRMLLQMQGQGVLLGIVSKNNEDDAVEILENHPHMVLHLEHFASYKINWEPKYKNIQRIASELNLGLDSFVFFDDSPMERDSIRKMLPEVEVPDFPERAENLTDAMEQIYKRYFAKTAITAEDLKKTEQYATNAKRQELQGKSNSFEEYLDQLNIEITRADAKMHIDRLSQLLNKTNQFNLTTKRYTLKELESILSADKKKVYLYGISDRFGDNGLVVAAVVDMNENIPVIEEFVMSCRVMGRNIEYTILNDIEMDMINDGHERLYGRYFPTAKNKPVADFYEKAGYTKVNGSDYVIELGKRPERHAFKMNR